MFTSEPQRINGSNITNFETTIDQTHSWIFGALIIHSWFFGVLYLKVGGFRPVRAYLWNVPNPGFIFFIFHGKVFPNLTFPDLGPIRFTIFIWKYELI